jgi:hypothetical protein
MADVAPGACFISVRCAASKVCLSGVAFDWARRGRALRRAGRSTQVSSRHGAILADDRSAPAPTRHGSAERGCGATFSRRLGACDTLSPQIF